MMQQNHRAMTLLACLRGVDTGHVDQEPSVCVPRIDARGGFPDAISMIIGWPVASQRRGPPAVARCSPVAAAVPRGRGN